MINVIARFRKLECHVHIGSFLQKVFFCTEPDYSPMGPSVQWRKRSPLEDPVKNAVCSRNVRPRRGL